MIVAALRRYDDENRGSRVRAGHRGQRIYRTAPGAPVDRAWRPGVVPGAGHVAHRRTTIIRRPTYRGRCDRSRRHGTGAGGVAGRRGVPPGGPVEGGADGRFRTRERGRRRIRRGCLCGPVQAAGVDRGFLAGRCGALRLRPSPGGRRPARACFRLRSQQAGGRAGSGQACRRNGDHHRAPADRLRPRRPGRARNVPADRPLGAPCGARQGGTRRFADPRGRPGRASAPGRRERRAPAPRWRAGAGRLLRGGGAGSGVCRTGAGHGKGVGEEAGHGGAHTGNARAAGRVIAATRWGACGSVPVG